MTSKFKIKRLTGVETWNKNKMQKAGDKPKSGKDINIIILF